MKSIIREIGSHHFPGFYESIFCYSDEFIDMESELANEFNIDGDLIHYEYTDFDAYKIAIGKQFMELYVEAIHDVLPYEITEDESFELEIIEEDIVIISPKYYNYDTDHCYCKIKTNKETLQIIKDYALKLKGANNYIIRHFTSRDGFISFISNDINYWKSLDICEYEENMLIALFDMLLKVSDDEIFRDISYDTEERVCRYEYAEPMVYFNKKDYNLYEFVELKQKEVSLE